MINDYAVRQIEDHALVSDFLVHVARSIRRGESMPVRVPALHDVVLLDALGSICEEINRCRAEKSGDSAALPQDTGQEVAKDAGAEKKTILSKRVLLGKK